MAERGEFALLDVIGCGGHGTVHRAQFIGEGGFRKEVAIKLLKSNVRDDPELALRLRDEARILGMLHHRAIVGVDRLTRIEGRWAVVMEFVQGEDLSALVLRGPMPVTVALAIIVEVASAIGAAYSTLGHDGRPLRLLHRDLKPSNVRVGPDGSVKVLDFGIARAEFTHREAETRSRTLGTEAYMAPERLDGVSDTPAGDVYSVGAILLELLRGHRLGRAYGAPERHERLCGEALGTLRALGVPPAVVAFAGELLSYSPKARPDVAEVERRAEELARRAEGPSLKAWAKQHVRVAAPPPPATPLDPDSGLRSGAILIESDEQSAEGTVWIKHAELLVSRHLQDRTATPPTFHTPTASTPTPPHLTMTLPPRPLPPAPPTLPPPPLRQISPPSRGSVDRPASSLERTVSISEPLGARGQTTGRSTPARPASRRRLVVPIVAAVVIALALLVATMLVLFGGGRGSREASGAGPFVPGGAVGSSTPPSASSAPLTTPPTIHCAPDNDGDGHGAKDGASPQPGAVCPAGWVTLSDDCDDTRAGVAPGRLESCDARDNDCDGRVDEGFEDRNSNGQPDCAEASPASGLNAQDRSRWLRAGLVLEAKVPKGCAPKPRVRLSGGGSWRAASKELSVQGGYARCGVPIVGAGSPEGAPLCGLPELSQVDLGSETAQIEWRCCYEGPKSKAGQGQREACHAVGGDVVTQPM